MSAGHRPGSGADALPLAATDPLIRLQAGEQGGGLRTGMTAR